MLCRSWFVLAAFAVALICPQPTTAQIYRWDTGGVIPGTEELVPGPGVGLSGLSLEFAALKNADLAGAGFGFSILSNASFRDANLAGAKFQFSTLAGADFSGATIPGAVFTSTTGARGFTRSQLYSTASYRDADLRDVQFHNENLARWNFTGQNLELATFTSSDVADAEFAGAWIWGTAFNGLNFTASQLYSTQSYQDGNLQGVQLGGNDFRGADLRDQDLAFAKLTTTKLEGADLSGSLLTNAELSSLLDEANLTGADLRGATNSGALSAAVTRNAIFPDGFVRGFNLSQGEVMVVRDDDQYVGGSTPFGWATTRGPISITVEDEFTLPDGAKLLLVLDDDLWDSFIDFETEIPVQLGGVLELAFEEGVDVHSQIGRRFQLFDWAGVSPQGQFRLRVPAGTQWDLTDLYSDQGIGEVALSSVQRPGDIDGDGEVSLDDFIILKANFGAVFAALTEGDLTGDFVIDLADFNVLKQNFGSSAAVPEPAALVLLAELVGVGVCQRRRRHNKNTTHHLASIGVLAANLL